MKLKILPSSPNSHKDACTCVGWSTTEEVLSIGDDHQLLSWNVSNNECSKLAELNSDLFPTDLQLLSKSGGSLSKHGDLILITSADGKFHIMNRTGRIERSIEAHKGAVLVGQWGHDGASLLSGGEDGFIKIWSRSGMLRSTVVSSDSSIYGACWSSDGHSIAYTHGKLIVIKNLAPNTKPLQWKAHEGTILCLAWSAVNELLVSGGEDCRYRVWDGQGRQVYSSNLHDCPVTCVAWSPVGDLLAVGSYNTLRLCDSLGWSRSLEKPNSGGIYKISWSGDGTQIAAACANVSVLFAHIVERSIHYQNLTATVVERKMVVVQDVLNDIIENLELPERVILMALRYSHLVLTTPSQCYIYSTSNWNTPTIFDLKDGLVTFMLLCEKHLLLVEKTTLGLYNYQGRLIGSPRWSNMKLDALKNTHITLSNDMLAVRDAADEKTVHLIDLGLNRGMSDNSTNVQHTVSVMQVALDQASSSSNRLLAVLDKARDLYVTQVKTTYRQFFKLGSQIQSFQWNTDQCILAAVQDTRVVVWYCPTAAFNSVLLRLCSFYYDSPELGKSPRISDFIGDCLSVRRGDGSLLNVMVSPFPALLHKHVNDGKWKEALSLCRTVNEGMLWCCLGVLATQAGADTLDIAEEAYAAIDHYDKVLYIKHIQDLPSRPQKMAATALLGGSTATADSILLHNGMVYQAICLHIQMHNWNRALDIAMKHKTHIDTVLYKRQKYLEVLEKEESNNKFSSLKDQVFLNEDAILEKIKNEVQKHGEM